MSEKYRLQTDRQSHGIFKVLGMHHLMHTWCFFKQQPVFITTLGKFHRKLGVVIAKTSFPCMNLTEILAPCIFGLNHPASVCFGGCGCLHHTPGNESPHQSAASLANCSSHFFWFITWFYSTSRCDKIRNNGSYPNFQVCIDNTPPFVGKRAEMM